MASLKSTSVTGTLSVSTDATVTGDLTVNGGDIIIGATGSITVDNINGDDISGGFLGIGQTWQNVALERTKNVTYTNNTGKAIMVSVGQYINATAHIYVDGIVATYGNTLSSHTAIVPAGSTYLFSNTYYTWSELR